MENLSVVGLDIAKNVFEVCGMNERGRVIFRKRLKRGQVLDFFAKNARSIVAIESCGGSSYWGRELKGLGHEVRLIPAQYVKPFVKSQKNDSTDAEAIAEAALRPTMRFVTPNRVEQQDLQNLHRVRERLVKNRNALCNQIRGLLLEYGIIIPQGRSHVRKHLSVILSENQNGERPLWKRTFARLQEELKELDDEIEGYNEELKTLGKGEPRCQALKELHGVGVLTSTAIIAAVNDPKDFKNGRQFAAWLGLVPRQESSGGKTTLRGITKRGNKYIRKLLVHGARMELFHAEKHKNLWALSVRERRGYNRAAVALANKTARRIWAILAGKTEVKNLAA